MKKNISSLKINGHGSSAGGSYSSVVINGSGNIDGDLDCTSLKINGQCTIKGDLKAGSMNIHGNGFIKGKVEAKEAKIHGTADIDGNVSVDKAETYGSINIDGDCNAEVFKIEGTFTIEGLLNAGELELSLYGPSKADEIGGEKINVKKKGKYHFLGLKSLIMPGGNKELTADIIEGDDIYLENTSAKVVRGNNIELGPGCEIELVEYNKSFKKDKKAKADANKQL